MLIGGVSSLRDASAKGDRIYVETAHKALNEIIETGARLFLADVGRIERLIPNARHLPLEALAVAIARRREAPRDFNRAIALAQAQAAIGMARFAEAWEAWRADQTQTALRDILTI